MTKEPQTRLAHLGKTYLEEWVGPAYLPNTRFVAQAVRAIDVVSKADCRKMGFEPDRLIFFCTKPLLDQSNLYAYDDDTEIITKSALAASRAQPLQFG